MDIKKEKYTLEGDATFKQGWKIANTFASQLKKTTLSMIISN